MQTYTCTYLILDHEDAEPFYFECEADDAEHAIEQFRDAEPNAILIGVTCDA